MLMSRFQTTFSSGQMVLPGKGVPSEAFSPKKCDRDGFILKVFFGDDQETGVNAIRLCAYAYCQVYAQSGSCFSVAFGKEQVGELSGPPPHVTILLLPMLGK